MSIRLVAAVAIGSIAIAAGARADTGGGGWEQLFSAEGGPTVHARARYVDQAGKEHRLELWRTGKTLRRDTDEALSLIVERRPGGDDQYHLVRHDAGDGKSAGHAYDVSRDQLYRIGSFPAWAQLATLLTRPRGEIHVVAGDEAKTAAGACRWYEATGEHARERICWSRALKLPLAVERWDAAAKAWAAAVTVDEARVGKIAGAVFHPRVDVARVDVDRDLD